MKAVPMILMFILIMVPEDLVIELVEKVVVLVIVVVVI